jgi:hypothetical protein
VVVENRFADPDAFFEQWLSGWPKEAKRLLRRTEGEWSGNLEAA